MMSVFARLPRQYTTFEGHRIAYAVAGSGPHVLLLHGLGGTADFWQPVVERLSAQFTLIVPDLLGFGYSDRPRTDYTLAQHTGTMAAVLGAVGNAELHAVVSHSVGGVVAIALVASGLAQLQRVALTAAPYPAPRFQVRQELIKVPFFNLLLRWRWLARIDTAFWHAIWPLLQRAYHAPDYLRGGWAGFLDYSADSLYSTADELLFRTDLDPFLRALQRYPTLLLHAQDDGTVPVVYAHRLHERLPHSELAILESGAHYAVLREGLETLAAWLTRQIEN